MFKSPIILLGLTVGISGIAGAQVPAGKPRIEAAFAYANPSGTALLSLNDAENAFPPQVVRSFDRAVCSNSRIFKVKFVTVQEESPHSTGRNTSQNFNLDRGHRFVIVDGRVKQNEVCLLVNQKYLTGKKAVTFTPSRISCVSTLRAVVPRLANRELASCFGSSGEFVGNKRAQGLG